jgi:hypothetical protein
MSGREDGGPATDGYGGREPSAADIDCSHSTLPRRMSSSFLPPLQQPDINLAQLLQTMNAEFAGNASTASPPSVRREGIRIGGQTANPGEPMVKISIAELRSIASQVLEGIRIRGFHGVTLHDATAAAAAERFDDTLLDGRASYDEPVCLATVLLAIADALDAENVERVGAQT